MATPHWIVEFGPQHSVCGRHACATVESVCRCHSRECMPVPHSSAVAWFGDSPPISYPFPFSAGAVPRHLWRVLHPSGWRWPPEGLAGVGRRELGRPVRPLGRCGEHSGGSVPSSRSTIQWGRALERGPALCHCSHGTCHTRSWGMGSGPAPRATVVRCLTRVWGTTLPTH